MTETQIMAKVRRLYREQYEKDHPENIGLDNTSEIDYITLMKEADDILSKELL